MVKWMILQQYVCAFVSDEQFFTVVRILCYIFMKEKKEKINRKISKSCQFQPITILDC